MGSASPTVASGSGAEHTSHDDTDIFGVPSAHLEFVSGSAARSIPKVGPALRVFRHVLKLASWTAGRAPCHSLIG
jgi:hypothetical protein